MERQSDFSGRTRKPSKMLEGEGSAPPSNTESNNHLEYDFSNFSKNSKQSWNPSRSQNFYNRNYNRNRDFNNRGGRYDRRLKRGFSSQSFRSYQGGNSYQNNNKESWRSEQNQNGFGHQRGKWQFSQKTSPREKYAKKCNTGSYMFSMMDNSRFKEGLVEDSRVKTANEVDSKNPQDSNNSSDNSGTSNPFLEQIEKLITPKEMTVNGKDDLTSEKKSEEDKTSDATNNSPKGKVISPRKSGRKRKMNNSKVRLPMFVINSNMSFDRQAKELISQVEQSESDRLKWQGVLQDLKKIFKAALPDVEPTPFGSTLTTLALKTSDLDVYLFCPGGQPKYNIAKEHSSLMFKSKTLFTDVVRIVHAQVPLIKAKHISSGINVDISASNRVSVCNSRLLRLAITRSDPRVRSLLLLICLFGKAVSITGCHKLSNYCWCLMTAFYLQVTKYPLLPPFYKLIDLEAEGLWPAVCKEDPDVFLTYNTLPLSQHFISFFKFYANFNFADSIISTFAGCAIPLDADPETLPSFFEDYKNIVGPMVFLKKKKLPLYVQEPIKLSRIITQNVRSKFFENIVKTCKVVSEFLSDLPEATWLSQLYSVFSGPIGEEVVIYSKWNRNWEPNEAFKIIESVFSDIFLFEVELVEIGKKLKETKKEVTTTPIWFQCSTMLNILSASRCKTLKHLSEIKGLTSFGQHIVASKHLARKQKPTCRAEFLVRVNYFKAAEEVQFHVYNMYEGRPKDIFKTVAHTVQQNLKPLLDLSLAEPNLQETRELVRSLLSSGNFPEDINCLKDFLRGKLQARLSGVTEDQAKEETTLKQTSNAFIDAIVKIKDSSVNKNEAV